MPKKAVVLLSGGVDSTTCLAIAKSQGFDCYTLAFDYGQKNRSELIAAEKIAHHFAVKKHLVFALPIAQFGGSALTDNSIAVPNYEGSETILATYVPARNTIFLAVALGYAETLQVNDIFIGVSQVDHSGYPDCRPDYFAAYANLANLATKTGVEGNKLTIHTPIIELSKAETISLGTQLGIDYAMTVSCYRADQDGRACGNCDSCTLRKLGYAEAGVVDNTKYL